MARRGKRLRIAPYVYRDGGGIEAIVLVKGKRKSKRFPLGYPLPRIQQWQREVGAKLGKMKARAATGTLEADIQRYLAQIGHIRGLDSRKAELNAFLKALPPRTKRFLLTPTMLRTVRTTWTAKGVAPKTINNRFQALKHLFRLLDGEEAENPAAAIPPLPVSRTPPIVIPAEVIKRVEENLRKSEHTHHGLRTSKTRARFMVLATTGRRPSEVMRAQPTDLDWVRRVWYVRDGKGGFTPGLYLNDEMLAAWELFRGANAWGLFDTTSFARRLRKAGWPVGVRPYNLRHTVGITLSEGGTDLADVQAQLGHKHLATTRKHYVPVLNSRMQNVSRQLENRFGWGANNGANTSAPKGDISGANET